MAIRFEAPGPFEPDTSIGAGSAEMYARMAPLVQHQQGQIAQLSEATARARMHGQQPMQVMPTVSAGYQPGGGGGGGYHEPPPPVQDRFTQAEQIRLQQLDNARVAIESRVQSGEWTPEEGNDALTQINTGYNILDQRRQRAQQSAIEQQNQMLMQQHARQSAWENMSATDRAQRMNEMVQVIRDEYNNPVARMWVNPRTGDFEQLRPEPTRGADAASANQERRMNLFRQIHEGLEREYTQMARDPIASGSMPEHLRTPQSRMAHANQVAREAARFAGLDDQVGGQPGQTRDNAIQAPFRADAPAEDRTDRQNEIINTWDSTVTRSRAIGQLAQDRIQVLVNQNKALLARYGSRRDMPREEQRRYDRAQLDLAEFARVIDRHVPSPTQLARQRWEAARQRNLTAGEDPNTRAPTFMP